MASELLDSAHQMNSDSMGKKSCDKARFVTGPDANFEKSTFSVAAFAPSQSGDREHREYSDSG